MTDKDEYVFATYDIHDRENSLAEAAKFLALMETTGPWHGAEPSPPLFKRCQGVVANVHETGAGSGLVTIGFPLENFNLADGAWDSLLISVIGGYAPAAARFARSRLVDLRIPPTLSARFPGPRFGRDGVRRMLAVRENEVAIGAIVKPVSGITPADVADDVRVMGSAGIEFIKDDQKMLNPTYCPLVERVRAVERALDIVEQERGFRPLYAPNVTTRVDRLLDNACRAIEAGARALMVTFVSSGFEALLVLAEAPEVNVPVYAHCGGKEVITAGSDRGIAPGVVVQLARLMGGDIMRLSAVEGDLVHAETEAVAEMHAMMTDDNLPMRPMLPAVSGGLNPGNLHRSLAATGADVLVLAGRGIVLHPDGPAAGVKALREAAAAHAAGIDVEAYAENHPALAAALQASFQ